MGVNHDSGPRAEVGNEMVQWILTEGRIQAVGADPAHDIGSPARFINELCRRLVSTGVPLWRMTLYAATLHPQLRGFGWRWWPKSRLTEEVRIAQGTELTEEFLRSPLRGT